MKNTTMMADDDDHVEAGPSTLPESAKSCSPKVARKFGTENCTEENNKEGFATQSSGFSAEVAKNSKPAADPIRIESSSRASKKSSLWQALMTLLLLIVALVHLIIPVYQEAGIYTVLIYTIRLLWAIARVIFPRLEALWKKFQKYLGSLIGSLVLCFFAGQQSGTDDLCKSVVRVVLRCCKILFFISSCVFIAWRYWTNPDILCVQNLITTFARLSYILLHDLIELPFTAELNEFLENKFKENFDIVAQHWKTSEQVNIDEGMTRPSDGILPSHHPIEGQPLKHEA
ncbi:uncharacterized protein LOC132200798 [Neocloeon triangulifer]|uniref:uncharacterized protein LOC132200798 n=1 Tax=Neocloeon triangulifer TaxID=2078957 RepID=UPI00286F74A3|nr:uncharacterized protein LOC132200798 [Neocloeon triangulifer]XP_059482510.1 uncharacterized protein LOC132200798 [Neocloeon triangulifer]XP_059482511.1 uncharacterized protein LOC132200798 [Neocloeon triangulifer]